MDPPLRLREDWWVFEDLLRLREDWWVFEKTLKFKEVLVVFRRFKKSNNPILRHIYKNMLDIEQLLSQYFYGFYTGQISYIRDYLYISWILWAYLVSEEQRKAQEKKEKDVSSSIYAQLAGKDCQLITFNYTSYASQASPTALYFHGSLKEYVDVENKNDFLHFCHR